MKTRGWARVPVPIAAGLLLMCAVMPGLLFAEEPVWVAVGVLFLLAAGPGLGSLILRHTCPHLSFRVRLVAATGLGLTLLAPAQLLAGLAGPPVALALDVAAAALGLAGLVLAARDWRAAPPGEQGAPRVTVFVTAAVVLAFCIPAAREMTFAPDGSLIVQYVDMPFHAADVVALEHVPARHPFLPSAGFHYHYLLNLIAARVVFATRLSPADALYRVVRPFALMGCLCGFAALPGLLIGGNTCRPIGWLGPAIACGLPPLQVLTSDWDGLANHLRHGDGFALAIPTYGWSFGGDMLMSVGGLGLTLLLPLMVILLPDRTQALRPRTAVIFGLIVGAMLGFNAPAYAFCVAGLMGAMVVELLRRRNVTGLAVALLVAVVWGLVLKGQIVGAGAGHGPLKGAHPADPVGVLLDSYRVARTALKLLHVQLCLAVFALVAVVRGARSGFIIGVLVTAIVAMAAKVFGDAAEKYLRECVSLGVACLAVGGVAWLVAFGGGVHQPLLRGLAGVYIGLLLPCGVLATTQFLWRNECTYRIAPSVARPLRAMAANLPPEAFVAGSETFVSSEFVGGAAVPAHLDEGTAKLESYVLRYAVVALLGRPVLLGAPNVDDFGYAADAKQAAASAADIARLFSVSDPSEAAAIARRHGITHVLLPPGGESPWPAAPLSPGLHLVAVPDGGMSSPGSLLND